MHINIVFVHTISRLIINRHKIGPLPAKKQEEISRASHRNNALVAGKKFLKDGDLPNARTQLSRAVDISPHMAAQLIAVCREMRPSVKCIVAPYEADAQLAYLIRQNIVDVIITEDSDTIPYGCKEVNRILL